MRLERLRDSSQTVLTRIVLPVLVTQIVLQFANGGLFCQLVMTALSVCVRLQRCWWDASLAWEGGILLLLNIKQICILSVLPGKRFWINHHDLHMSSVWMIMVQVRRRWNSTAYRAHWKRHNNASVTTALKSGADADTNTKQIIRQIRFTNLEEIGHFHSGRSVGQAQGTGDSR